MTRQTASAPVLKDGLRSTVVAALVATGLLFGVLLVWASQTMINGAVIAAGQVVVHGKPKVVQTVDGGEIAEIAVRNGERVQAGQVLVRLDPTMPRINLEMATGRLAEALARRARLESEQLGLPAPLFRYPDLPFPLPELTRQEAGQRQIFLARAEVLRGQREQMVERLGQLASQIVGMEAQIAARRDQLASLEDDLDKLSRLRAQGLVRQGQISELQRAVSDMHAQISVLGADLARSVNTRRDIELETLQAERSFQEEVVTELRSVTALIDELTLEIVTRQAQLKRIEIRAPTDGTVHQLQATTTGGVLAQGATVVEILPLEEGMAFELRVEPRSVSQVYPGQPATVVMAAFNSRTTPRLEGQVVSVSPAAITDPATRQSYYLVELTIPPQELARLGAVDLAPGMPVEAFMGTAERSVWSYLVEPLAAQLRRAFREA